MPIEFNSAAERDLCVVEENDERDEGCKKKENISLFFETTAGMLALICPCGIVNQRRNDSAGAKILLENVKFLVDIFHVSKHTEEVCMPPNNPKCKYHPFLPGFDAIRGTNTESCEQGFRRLNEYFKLTRKMLQFKRNVLFWFVNERFNNDLECELRRKDLI
ncbi:Hypothetical predicted protein [Paramuricea clavata]|uniref:Uncharacterized protein n=1 Tax=Paramuricea clavata TaxID=317549 RepID=A0A6S7JVB7_PARCT|nr:Hypothetical predicted protein [Paramuricea clavata]